MVEKHVVVICAAVGALALAAAVLGIIGEATKSRSFVRYDGVNCVYRRTPAFDCGIAAAASLLTGQAILTAAAGCWDGCRQRRSSSNHRRVGGYFASILSCCIICSVVLKKVRRAACRFLTILSTCAFLAGALRNDSTERRPKEGVASYYQCTVLVAGVFAGASFLSLAAAVVGIASYVAIEGAASTVVSPSAELRVVLGQPQQL
ncbi:uncharacterized protein [Aegilops tauschii subsp. strangulata]|uniref:uncharacterized protein n=1 Tax=Aegilops tauschii subsp. strangulata TaxID=200361 RepID=UPI001ABC962F|nr:uncharacterized protein LOC109737111 [Aegilops tauschii subsp. strangulata]